MENELQKLNRCLVLDTSTAVASVAWFEKGRVRAYAEEQSLRQHAALILPMVDHVLETAGVGMKDVESVVVCQGPGSFTGVRVGIATAIGLTAPTGIPLVQFSSTYLLYCCAAEAVAVTVMDAKRGEWYYEMFVSGDSVARGLAKPNEVILKAEQLLSDRWEESFIVGTAETLAMLESKDLLLDVVEVVPSVKDLIFSSKEMVYVTSPRASYFRKSQAEEHASKNSK